jgi:divalent metal cation (Fe/Co/Zn/Cd) transporter
VIKACAAVVKNPRGDGSSSTTAVYAALIGDILVAVSKAAAAVWTGSASMMSEAIHSFIASGRSLPV